MRKSPPFTRRLAVVLVVTILQSCTAWALSPVPGSLAVLEPPMPLPEMRAAWDGIRNEIYLDPLLLVKGREEVLRELEEWGLAARSIGSAYRTADKVTLDKTQALVENAWAFYYQFDYERAAEVLGKAEKLLSTPGDSAFRTPIMFEVLLLRGIVARAAGNNSYINDFKRAAALDPARELPSERYSPETINIYSVIRRELLAGERVSLVVDGMPEDASILIGGGKTEGSSGGQGYLVLPGKHFIDVSAPGYEPWGLSLDVRKFEPAKIRFELVPTGPEGNPDSFFLQRLRAGDRAYMVRLAEKLDVDYLLVPDPEENVLRAWLIDREGRSVEHIALWEAADTKESVILRVAKLLEPLRQKWDHSRTTEDSPLSLPAISPDLPEDSGTVKGSAKWSKYALAIGVLLLVGAAATGDRSGGTRIEATW